MIFSKAKCDLINAMVSRFSSSANVIQHFLSSNIKLNQHLNHEKIREKKHFFYPEEKNLMFFSEYDTQKEQRNDLVE